MCEIFRSTAPAAVMLFVYLNMLGYAFMIILLCLYGFVLLYIYIYIYDPSVRPQIEIFFDFRRKKFPETYKTQPFYGYRKDAPRS